MKTLTEIDTIRERLRRAGWVVVRKTRLSLARAWVHRVVLARGGREVTGEGATRARAWAEAERRALGGE